MGYLQSLYSQNVTSDLPLKLQQFLKPNSEPLKDVDYVMLRQYFPSVFQLNLDPSDEQLILDALESDSKFLSNQGLMDYSILIGIEEIKSERKVSKLGLGIQSVKQSQDTSLQAYKFLSKCQKFIYHVSIIDFLQTFTLKKKAELAYKATFKSAKVADISSMPPKEY